jgi:hypothetical protein
MKEVTMNRKLVASALGALMLGTSGMVLADGWNAGAIERAARQTHGDHGWRGSDRHDWERGHREWRGHGHHPGQGHYRGHKHYRGHGHYKRHNHYRHDHYRHGGWKPHHYDRDGVTIIFRGSFY